jgi:alpha/beta superfamily hydrolase
VAQGSKKKWRDLADIYAAFGPVYPAPTETDGGWSYGGFIGLLLNTDRARSQWAVANAQGAGIAASSSPVDIEFFRAITDTDDAAEMLMARTNMERMRKAVLAKYGIK